MSANLKSPDHREALAFSGSCGCSQSDSQASARSERK